MFKLSQGASVAINALNAAGYEAYAVGGAIRDTIMGRAVNDFDVTTNATPEQMKAVFSDMRIIETGIKHGTLTLLHDGETVEITTYRIDGEYADNRHPESVSFTSELSEDLSRRDFTINALAYDPISDTLVDLFDGVADIENKQIRAIGDPKRRFSEDALRILRAIRFASVLEFDIEERTREAMRECIPLLASISRERIAVELNKLLCGKGVKRAILENVDILSAILPEIGVMNGFDQKNSWHIYDVLTHTAVAVESIEPEPHLRLMAFLHDIGKVHTFSLDERGVGHFYGHNGVSAERARQFFNEYKYDNLTKDRVCNIIALHDTHIEEDKIYIKKRMNRMGKEAFFDLLKLQKADNLAQNPEKVNMAHFDIVKSIADKIIEEESCFSLKDLAVNGTDLIENGFEKGKKLGEILAFLLNEVIEERIPNEKIMLLKKAKEQFGG